MKASFLGKMHKPGTQGNISSILKKWSEKNLMRMSLMSFLIRRKPGMMCHEKIQGFYCRIAFTEQYSKMPLMGYN